MDLHNFASIIVNKFYHPYPIPQIDNTLDTLSESQWFSTVDLLSGYWQAEVAEEDKPKTAFTTHVWIQL